MDNQMLNSMRNVLRSHIETDHRFAKGFRYYISEHVKEGVYNIDDQGFAVERGSDMPVGTVFLRGQIAIPDEILNDGEYEYMLCIALEGREGHLYVNGELYHGVDGNRRNIPLRNEWRGRTLDIEILAKGSGRVSFIGTVRVSLAAQALNYTITDVVDYLALESRNNVMENRIIDVKIETALDEALFSLDSEAEPEVYHEQCRAAEKKLRAALDAIDDGDVRGLLSLIGHTHIDVAWLWQLKDTVRKCGHTFSTMLRLMDRYPEFIFTCSQMQLLDYAKRFYPGLFEQIKVRADEGRWENIGSMWLESDCNITSGESLVRQFLYGSRFEKENFGTHSRVAWLPDTFSFQPNIPQIMKKSGVNYFYTYKIHWQRRNPFPYNVFKWKGIDGSEVICSATWEEGAYNGDPRPSQLRFAKEHNPQQGQFDNVIFPYGFGDGGGGPTAEMIENARRFKDFPGLPRTEMIRADTYFDRLNKRADELPKYYGELYIETHRGTMTSQGRSKRNNRMAELGCQSDEKLAVMAEFLGAKPDWSLMNECWKHVLLMQFHDILPGSSINSVYTVDSKENYAAVADLRQKFLASAGLGGNNGNTILAVNTLSWKRDAVCAYNAGHVLPADSVIADSDENLLPCVLNDARDTVTFLAKDIPAMGARAYHLAHRKVEEKMTAEIRESTDGLAIETALYRAEIDTAGRIASLYDKNAGRLVLSAPGNDLKLYADGPQDEDAWNLYEDYVKREVTCDWKVSLSVIENSAFRAVIKVEKEIKGCKIAQNIIFFDASPVIEFRTVVDWSLRHRLLRVYFPVDVRMPNAAYETGFGTYYRPTIASTADEKQKFEVCAHKFADLSESSYGMSLLNDCKYAHSCDDNLLGLSLLRGTTFPDPDADIGIHEIGYAIYPHTGSYADACTPRRAHEFNMPVRLFNVAVETARIADGQCLLTCDVKDIVVDTVKRAENGDGIIIRAYEANGNSGRAAITLNGIHGEVFTANLIEQDIGKYEVANNSFSFAYKPFEILTFRVR